MRNFVFQLREDFDSGADVTLTDEVLFITCITLILMINFTIIIILIKIVVMIIIMIITVLIKIRIGVRSRCGDDSKRIPPRSSRAAPAKGGLPPSAFSSK